MRQNYCCVHSKAEKMAARGHVPELGSGRARAGLPIAPRHMPVAGRLPCSICPVAELGWIKARTGLLGPGDLPEEKRMRSVCLSFPKIRNHHRVTH